MVSQQQLDFVTVDVFTSTPYEGNPLAIIRIPHDVTISQDQKQKIAREFNLSESTFLHEKAPGDEGDDWTVDIFMTTKELPFAGEESVSSKPCSVLTTFNRSSDDWYSLLCSLSSSSRAWCARW
ncbi:MAG: PhzF family phenazine biosynthesis protein, partial [Cytophagaceae bacterium]